MILVYDWADGQATARFSDVSRSWQAQGDKGTLRLQDTVWVEMWRCGYGVKPGGLCLGGFVDGYGYSSTYISTDGCWGWI